MISNSVNVGCGRKMFLVTLALVVVNMTGCALFSVTTKRFTPQDEQHPYLVFPDHELETNFSNSLYSDNDNLFRISICQRQAVPPDSVDTRTLDYVRLEDLGISFGGKGELIRPRRTDLHDVDWREMWEEGGYLHGPVHDWGWLHIPKSYDWIEVTYTAILVSGDDLNEINRRIVSQALYRVHEKESFLVK